MRQRGAPRTNDPGTRQAIVEPRARRQTTQTRRVTRLSGLTFAVLLTLLVGQELVFGHDDNDRKEPSKLAGTWDVTLRFPCEANCPCPGNQPNLPIPSLHMYLKDGSFVDAGGGSFFRGPSVGSWKHIGRHQCEVIGPYEFEVRYKFYLFNDTVLFSRRGYEVVTNCIHLTGPDTFVADAIFHLFDTSGDETSPDEGCRLHGEAQRFE